MLSEDFYKILDETEKRKSYLGLREWKSQSKILGGCLIYENLESRIFNLYVGW